MNDLRIDPKRMLGIAHDVRTFCAYDMSQRRIQTSAECMYDALEHVIKFERLDPDGGEIKIDDLALDVGKRMYEFSNFTRDFLTKIYGDKKYFRVGKEAINEINDFWKDIQNPEGDFV